MRISRPFSIAASFLLVMGIFFYFVRLAPYMTDNFVFSHDIIPGYAQFYSGADITTQPMTVSGAFRQACEMYTTWCGRFAGNMAVYLLFMLPHFIYCLLAACVFCLYILLLQMCIFGQDWRRNLTPAWIFGIAGMLWISIPSFGEAFFWLSVGGQIALLAQAAILLPFRFAFDSEIQQKTHFAWLLCPLFLFGGIIACSLDYPTSAAMPVTAVAAVIYIWVRQNKGNRHFPWMLLWGTVGLCLGSAATILAPGNAQRLLLTTDTTIHEYLAASWMERIFSWLWHLPLSAIMLAPPMILIIWSCWRLWKIYGKDWWKKIPPASCLFLLPAILTHGAYLFTAWPPPRAFCTCAAQLVVCGCILFVTVLRENPRVELSRAKFLFIGCALICLSTLCYESMQFYELNKLTKTRESIIFASKDGTAILPRLNVKTDRYQPLGGRLPDIKEDPDFWVNRAMAAHYGLKKVAAAPKIINDHGNILQADFSRLTNEEPLLDNLSMDIDKERLTVSVPDIDKRHLEGQLHAYYHGQPGLLDILWIPGSKKIFDWLAEAKKGEWRYYLLPLLLARVDMPLVPDKNGNIQTISDPLNLAAPNKMWIVRPGAHKYSFDLLPVDMR